MDSGTAHQLVGYIASALIAASMMMNSIRKLRMVNLVGASTMATYGLLIGAYPITALNSFIVLVDCYYLFRIFRREEFFSLLEVKPDSAYLRHFVEFNRADIDRFLPGFGYTPADDQFAFFVLRDTVPAGLLITEPPGGGEARVLLDYVTSGYRDFKIGQFVFYSNGEAFRKRGIRRLRSAPGTEAHRTYLKRMGFSPDPGGKGEETFVLDLDPAAVGQAGPAA